MTNSFIEGLLKLPEHISDFRLANRPSGHPYHFFFFFAFSRRRVIVALVVIFINAGSENCSLEPKEERERERGREKRSPLTMTVPPNASSLLFCPFSALAPAFTRPG